MSYYSPLGNEGDANVTHGSLIEADIQFNTRQNNSQ